MSPAIYIWYLIIREALESLGIFPRSFLTMFFFFSLHLFFSSSFPFVFTKPKKKNARILQWPLYHGPLSTKSSYCGRVTTAPLAMVQLRARCQKGFPVASDRASDPALAPRPGSHCLRRPRDHPTGPSLVKQFLMLPISQTLYEATFSDCAVWTGWEITISSILYIFFFMSACFSCENNFFFSR